MAPPTRAFPRSSDAASPISLISPLNYRKGSHQLPTTMGPTSPHEVSPTSPQDAAGAPVKVPQSRFSHSTQGSRRSTKTNDRNMKALVDANDFSGLQVDDRKPLPALPEDQPPSYQTEQNYGAPIANEKRQFYDYNPPNHGVNGPQLMRGNTNATASTSTSRTYMTSPDVSEAKEVALIKEKSRGPPLPTPASKPVRNRKRLWVLGAAIALIVIVGVVVGAVVGTQHHKSATATTAAPSSTPSPVITPTAAPTVYEAALPNSAAVVDTPLAAISYFTNSSDKNEPAGTQNYELYYLNKCNLPKQDTFSGAWGDYGGSLFTDTKNNTGMAAINYYNASVQQQTSYVFYIGYQDNVLRDKKYNPAKNEFDIGPLSTKKIVVGPASASATDNSSSMPYDGYSLAAAYSENFPQGPSGRLFYHATNSSSGTHYIQELIWAQAEDSWSFGNTFPSALQTSKLAAVVDEANAALRLMFAVAPTDGSDPDQPWLQEYYYMLSGGNSTANWQQGQVYKGLLQHNSSAFALAAGAGNSFLYHATPANSSTAALAIQEVPLSSANSSTPPNMALASTVAVPDWMAQNTGGTVPTVFAPIAAVGGAGELRVFYADGVVDARAGYTKLSAVSRRFGDSWDANPGTTSLPMDDACSQRVI